MCNVRLKREEEGAGSSRTKIQGVALSQVTCCAQAYIASSPPLGHDHSLHIYTNTHTFPLPQLVQAVTDTTGPQACRRINVLACKTLLRILWTRTQTAVIRWRLAGGLGKLSLSRSSVLPPNPVDRSPRNDLQSTLCASGKKGILFGHGVQTFGVE